MSCDLILTDDDLADLQALSDANLLDLCTLQNPPGTPDGQGGESGDYTTVATGVAVRIGYGTDQAYEHLVGEAFQGQMRATLTFKSTQTISVKQRALIGLRKFEIHGFKDEGALRVNIKAYCTELQA
jgi:hypothetical protein